MLIDREMRKRKSYRGKALLLHYQTLTLLCSIFIRRLTSFMSRRDSARSEFAASGAVENSAFEDDYKANFKCLLLKPILYV